MKKLNNEMLKGRKVFGYWGIGGGFEYGTITNIEEDAYGTDIIIEWEENGLNRYDIGELNTNTNEESLSIGIHLLENEEEGKRQQVRV